MFLYGVRRRPDDRFAARCLPSIIRYGGERALVLTSERAEYGAASRDLIEQAAEVTDLEALILLDPDVELTGEDFVPRVRAALATVVGRVNGHGRPQTPGMVCLSDSAHRRVDPANGFAVLAPDVVRAIAASAEELTGHVGPIGYADALEQWVAAAGRPVVGAELPVARHTPRTSTIDRLTQVLAASRQGSWAEQIEQVLRRPAAPEPVQRRDPSPTDAPDMRDIEWLGIGTAESVEIDADGRGLSGFRHPERPDLLCHVTPEAHHVLVVGHDPEAVAAVIRAATGAVVTTILSPGPGPLAEPIDLTAGAPYDTVLLVEALAHVRDPEGLLRDVVGVLAPDGRVIAALPNAKHWTHVLPLLLNDQIRYGDASLLRPADPVRLFTLVEATQLFDRVGLTTYDFCNGTRYPVADPPEIDTLLSLHATAGVNIADARTLLTCFQYVFVTRRAAG